MIVWMAKTLLYQGKDIGKDILMFMMGQFAGTVIGAIIAYHFKKPDEIQNGEAK